MPNYLREFSPDSFSTRYGNEWGEALNFDGERSAAVREFFVSNARYWIAEFHFDGRRRDQVAPSLRRLRLHQRTSPGRGRAVTALLLLSPQLPPLFQGQEFAASAPFLYFADHAPEWSPHVEEGRRKFMRQA